jgi:hypothetical protein
MAKTILQINYKFTSSRAEHTALVTPNAEHIAVLPGLVWKVWLMNEAEQETGGDLPLRERRGSAGLCDQPGHHGFCGASHPLGFQRQAV